MMVFGMRFAIVDEWRMDLEDGSGGYEAQQKSFKIFEDLRSIPERGWDVNVKVKFFLQLPTYAKGREHY